MSREISDIFSRVSDYILRAKYYLSRYHYWRYAKYIEVNFRCKDMGAFFDGISGAAITTKYNPMNAELLRNKKLRDKIADLKKQLINI